MPTEPSTHDRETRRAVVRSERDELLAHLEDLLEPLMVVLGLVFLVLLLLDFSGVALTHRQRAWLDGTFQTIWIIFVGEFAIRLIIAPDKWRFLRHNWLGVLSLLLPFLRPLRILQAARALRSLSLVRLLGGLNRGMRVLRRVTRGRQIAYVAALTVLVVLAGAVGVLYFDRGVPGAPIQTFGDALWWSAAMVTTINNEKYAVSPEARVIAILERIFAVSVFGFVTASIASYLIGSDAAASAEPASGETDRLSPEELAALRTELVALRRELAALGLVTGRQVNGAAREQSAQSRQS
jgi:voltage-gated potassium channel